MLLGRAGVAAADTGASSPTSMPAASNAIISRRRMRFRPPAEVRIVRTLTPQVLDWKDRTARGEPGQGRPAACLAGDGAPAPRTDLPDRAAPSGPRWAGTPVTQTSPDADGCARRARRPDPGRCCLLGVSSAGPGVGVAAGQPTATSSVAALGGAADRPGDDRLPPQRRTEARMPRSAPTDRLPRGCARAGQRPPGTAGRQR